MTASNCGVCLRGRRVVVEIDGTWFPGVAQAACGKGKGKGKGKSKRRRQGKSTGGAAERALQTSAADGRGANGSRGTITSWWTVRFDDSSLLVCHLSAACRGLKWVFEFEAHD